MTTMILCALEDDIREKTGKKDFKITDAFDCVIGTSAGGLTTLALAAGFSANELKVVMKEMIPETFKDPRGSVQKWFKPAYDEANLEGQIRKHINKKLGFAASDNPTIADLVAKNPRLRTCITAVNYHFDEKEGGPSFTPRIFDTLNHDDHDITILSVARATSAAPTYFKPSTVTDKKDDG